MPLRVRNLVIAVLISCRTTNLVCASIALQSCARMKSTSALLECRSRFLSSCISGSSTWRCGPASASVNSSACQARHVRARRASSASFLSRALCGFMCKAQLPGDAVGGRYGGCNVAADEAAPQLKRDVLNDEATRGRVDDKISRARDGSNQPRDQSGRLDVRM